ncbi:MAG: hypothetical protein AB8G95_25975 [Anaerolineae bacterium]
MKNIKFLSIPLFVSAILFGGLWMATEPATASPDEEFIAPPGPICRNGASGHSTDFNLAYGSTGAGGMDLGFSVGFSPQVATLSDSQGYIETIPTIRFKPRLDSSGNRIPSEYWLVNSFSDKITYDSSELNPYFSEPEEAPAPYTKGMGPIIRANPGRIWIIGNEVDREQFQDSLLPETFARAYHDAYAYVKKVDPTAQIAVSGLVNFAPDRKQYLDLVFNEYRRLYGHDMPVDIWTMHAYNLWGRSFGSQTSDAGGSAIALGTDPNLVWQNAIENGIFKPELCSREDVICVKEHDDVALFQQQVVSMRQWMKNHGYQEKPLILTEWGLNLTSLFCDENNNRITPQRAADFLTSTVNWMNTHTDSELGYSLDDGRLVQRWAWFTIFEEGDIPAISDISYLIADYTITTPACGGADPVKSPNAGNANALTVVGQAYRDVIAAQHVSTPPSVDFIVDGVSSGAAVLGPNGEPTAATLGVTVRNIGNSPTGVDAIVRVRDASDDSVIGEFTVPPNFQGCTTSVYYGSVSWPHSTAGTFAFNVEIVSPEETASAKANNAGSGTTFIGQHGIFLPLAAR